MGLFNKLKNALFEEEEINLEPTPDKVVINDDSVTKKESATPKIKKEIPLENERELFKAENTFNFPDFDEEEFVTNYEPTREKEPVEEKVTVPKREVNYDKIKPITYEKEPKREVRNTEPMKTRERAPIEKATPEKKAFRPSPVISPVYGIMDKNIKKEEFVSREKASIAKRSLDVDMARKKAFGSLAEDLTDTVEEFTKKFYRDDTKSIDDLLKDSIDETIELKFDEPEEVEEETLELKNFTSHIEEELDTEDENLENYEEPKKKEKNEKFLEENTLESDLFDLIDSMYDNREDEEE